jgi:hypothetical protein
MSAVLRALATAGAGALQGKRIADDRRFDEARALENERLRRTQMDAIVQQMQDAAAQRKAELERQQQRDQIDFAERGFTPLQDGAVQSDFGQARATMGALRGGGAAFGGLSDAFQAFGQVAARRQASQTGGYAKTGLNAAERGDYATSARDKRQNEAQAARDASQLAARQAERDSDRAFQVQQTREQRDFMASENARNRAATAANVQARLSDSGPVGRPIPAGMVQSIATNDRSLATIDEALSALDADPRALGVKAYIPQVALNRLDPTGVAGRAAVADIGSLEIRDRSGAAVTASEAPRLKPFIPLPTDDTETARKKLTRLRAAIQQERDALGDYYGPDQGYMPLPSRGRGTAPAPAPAAATPNMMDPDFQAYVRNRVGGRP